MAKQRKLVSKIKKQKKKWFIVKAPGIYNNQEIGEIPAFEPNNLLGRTIEVSFKDLTGSPKEVTNKVVLKITKVQGETALTEPIKFFVSESYIQTIGKRSKKRFEIVVTSKTKDEHNVKIKVLISSKSKFVRSTGSDLVHTAKKEISNFVEHTNVEDLFAVPTNKKLAMILRKNLKKIYPINAYTWKITVIE